MERPLPSSSPSAACRRAGRAVALGLLGFALAGCPFGDPAPDVSLFRAVFENRTQHEQLQIDFDADGAGREFLTPQQRSASIELHSCARDLVASAPDGTTYELDRLCPGDVWLVGDRVIPRPSRQQILDWCDEADAVDGAAVDVWERFAEHGFTNRHNFQEYLEARDDSARHDELASAAGATQSEICQITRDDAKWSASTD